MLAELSRATPLALYAPALEVALAELRSLKSSLELGEEPEADDPFTARLLGGELGALGVDPRGPALLVPSPTGEAMVVVLSMANRAAFEAWLEQSAKGKPALKDIELLGEHVRVLDPAGDRPLACLARRSRLYCQLGASSGVDPIALLRTVLPAAAPTLAHAPGMVQAYLRLPPGGDLYLLSSPEAGTRTFGQWMAAQIEREHRFAGALERKAAQLESQLVLRRARSVGEAIEGVAAALYDDEERLTVRAELALTDAGVRGLKELSPPPGSGLIERWSETPSLARLYVRLRPEHAEQLLRALGLDAPASALNGTLAMLTLGLDAECAAARDAQASRPSWAFVLPSALAIGLKPKASTDRLEQGVAQLFERQGVERVRTEAATEDAAAPLQGRAFGSTLEVRVKDELMLIGTGPGSAAAAERRLSALPPGRSRAVAPWLAGSISLRAVDAAFEASDIGADARPELRTLERWRARLRPLLHRVDLVRLEATASEAERRASIGLVLEP